MREVAALPASSVSSPVHRRRLPVLLLAVLGLLSGCAGRSHLVGSAPSSRPTNAVPITSTTESAQTTPTLERVAFFDQEQGYGLFEQRSADGSLCTWLIAKTTDGGAHFDRLGTVDSWSCANNPDASFLAFDDHGDGFVYGPQLFVTHDGGRTWTAHSEPGTVLAVSALGYSIWMVEARCNSTNAPASDATCPLAVFESADGGRNWGPAPSEPQGAAAGAAAPSLESAQGQSWLLRVNQSSAYVMSNPTSTQNGSSNTVPLWHTNDGGVSWMPEQVPCGLSALSAVMDRAPDGTLVAVCAGEPSAGFQPKSMSVSSDEGVNWSVESQCADRLAPQCTSSPLSYGYLGSVSATSPSTVFVTGVRSPLVATHDGGASWNADQSIGDVNGSPAQVVFFDATNGIVLGRENTGTSPVVIWHTADGGGSWSELTPRFS